MKERNKNHITALDGLRGWAILIVLISHVSDAFSQLSFHGTGRLGVFLFFVLSAYLLDHQIINFLSSSHEKKKILKFWLNYFLRRFLRIYPLFMVALLFNVVFYYIDKTKILYVGGLTGFWEHITLQNAVGVFWSIGVELKYYLLSPILMLLLYKILKWKFSLVSIFFVLSLISIKYYLGTHNFDDQTFIVNLPLFLIGSYFAFLVVFFKDYLLRKLLIIKYIAWIGFLFPIILVPVYFGVDKEFFHSFTILLGIAFSITLLSVVLFHNEILTRILSNKFLVLLGRRSFSIYLFHINVIRFCKTEIGENWLGVISSFVLSIILTYVTYILIEKQLARIRIEYEN